MSTNGIGTEEVNMGHKNYKKRAMKIKGLNTKRFKKTCYVCGENFKPNEVGHYECKTIFQGAN
mgnify:CR=1 FL=1